MADERLRADRLQFGAGVVATVLFTRAEVAPRERDHYEWVERVRIVQALEVEVVVNVDRREHSCGRCGAKMPLPEWGRALQHVLKNFNNGALIFPVGENERLSPDYYPCAGWHAVPPLVGVFCPACSAKIHAAMYEAAQQREGCTCEKPTIMGNGLCGRCNGRTVGDPA